MVTNKLTHFDENGQAIMVNVSEKLPTQRIATAQGKIRLNAEAYNAVEAGTIKKGDVLGIARVAGIMGLKKTSELIPLCHTLLIEKASIDFELLPQDRTIVVECIVQTTGKTGVEMEALTGVNITLLTIYDMCKALDKSMVISDVCLVEKIGGKSGHYVRQNEGE